MMQSTPAAPSTPFCDSFLRYINIFISDKIATLTRKDDRFHFIKDIMWNLQKAHNPGRERSIPKNKYSNIYKCINILRHDQVKRYMQLLLKVGGNQVYHWLLPLLLGTERSNRHFRSCNTQPISKKWRGQWTPFTAQISKTAFLTSTC
jgi:hypothetical protein